ncbi:hypothetical protein [Herpetosiphon geysericola]|uniref:Uncharacterized protein n=1 Tax=Herpetosiphon geysericola TaxID=70996 RepID=A0A0P6YPM8_9CHLR|nr:hypothetical protein [Herpetosiphon geysericola]KPL84912.1 hypothetical protein SE18_18710 [Herpetosiphon geysericola]
MSYFVKKIEWEYGEAHGDCFYPNNQADFQAQLQALELRARQKNYPFYVELEFEDDSYIGFIIGHDLSCFYFGIFIADDRHAVHCRTQFDSHYDPQIAHPELMIEYSFKADHGEKYMPELLPHEQVVQAINQYIETQRLPAYILFTKRSIIDRYIEQ